MVDLSVLQLAYMDAQTKVGTLEARLAKAKAKVRTARLALRTAEAQIREDKRLAKTPEGREASRKAQIAREYAEDRAALIKASPWLDPADQELGARELDEALP